MLGLPRGRWHQQSGCPGRKVSLADLQYHAYFYNIPPTSCQCWEPELPRYSLPGQPAVFAEEAPVPWQWRLLTLKRHRRPGMERPGGAGAGKVALDPRACWRLQSAAAIPVAPGCRRINRTRSFPKRYVCACPPARRFFFAFYQQGDWREPYGPDLDGRAALPRPLSVAGVSEGRRIAPLPHLFLRGAGVASCGIRRCNNYGGVWSGVEGANLTRLSLDSLESRGGGGGGKPRRVF